METVQVRYRCTACAALVTITYPYLTSILAVAVTRHASGEPDDFQGDFVAMLCAACVTHPETWQRLEHLEGALPVVESQCQGASEC